MIFLIPWTKLGLRLYLYKQHRGSGNTDYNGLSISSETSSVVANWADPEGLEPIF